MILAALALAALALPDDVLTGRVVDARGEGLPGVRVRLVWSARAAHVFSDEQGRFELRIAAGAWGDEPRLILSRPAGAGPSDPVHYDVTWPRLGRGALDLGDLAPFAMGTLVGRLVDRGSREALRGRVQATARTPTGRSTALAHVVRTEVDPRTGEFVLGDLPAGTYLLQAWSSRTAAGREGGVGGAEVTVEAGVESFVEVELGAPPVLVLDLAMPPFPDRMWMSQKAVLAHGVDGSVHAARIADGRARFVHLPPGEYALSFPGGDFEPIVGPFGHESGPHALHLVPRTGVRLTLAAPPDRALPARVGLQLRPRAGDAFGAPIDLGQIDPTAAHDLRLPVGPYWLQVRAPGWAAQGMPLEVAWREWRLVTLTVADPAPVEVVLESALPGLDLGGVALVVEGLGAPADWTRAALTDTAGHARLDFSPGPHRLRGSLGPWCAFELLVPDGGALGGRLVVPLPVYGWVEVTAPAGHRVRCELGDEFVWEHVDEAGRVRFGPLPARRATVSLERRVGTLHETARRIVVEVVGGETVRVDLHLDGGGGGR